MWGPGIVGYGEREYRNANGQDAEICSIGFSPRASSLVFYLPGFEGKAALLKKLGKHRTGVDCLYVNKLADIDLKVLQEIVEKSFFNGPRSNA